jgi:branched-chain amino acid aminotransferase
MYPTKLAREEGYDNVIWTDAREHSFIEESGAMNLMFVIDGKLLNATQFRFYPGWSEQKIHY